MGLRRMNEDWDKERIDHYFNVAELLKQMSEHSQPEINKLKSSLNLKQNPTNNKMRNLTLSPRTRDVQMSKGSILLVDDDKEILEQFQMTFLKDGYDVETAVSGMEALSKVKENKYDVAVLDVVLPDIRGDKLALEIKRHCDSVNIIFITGYANMVDCINSLPIGVSDILLKPITVEELQQAVKDALNRKPHAHSET